MIRGLYLYTPFCGTCGLAGKMLNVIEELLPELEMTRQDLNYAPEIAEEFQIMSVPCLLLFKDEQLVEQIYAFQSVPFLLTKIKQL